MAGSAGRYTDWGRSADARVAHSSAENQRRREQHASDGAAWLLHAGIAANQSLFERAQGIVDEIRRLRVEARQLAQEHAAESAEQGEQAHASPEQARHAEGQSA